MHLRTLTILKQCTFILFGLCITTAFAAPPETTLNLKLRGIVKIDTIPDTSSNLKRSIASMQSSAIIENSTGKQSIYYVGDYINGDPKIVIHEIYTQHLVLQHFGENEKLTLFSSLHASQTTKNQPVVTPSLTPKAPLIDKRNNKALGKSLLDLKHAFKTNPLSIMGTINIEPFREAGKFQGYKVSSGKNKLLFVQLGLVKGDVITQINDIEMSSALKILSLSNTLSSNQEFEVHIMRRGKPLIFHYLAQ